MAAARGFQRLIESGVGTDLLVPRVSWHAIPGRADLGKKLFPDGKKIEAGEINANWTKQLKDTPGECGWVRFRDVSATAPSLGIAAVAYALAELGNSEAVVVGRATLWSPCLPPWREASVPVPQQAMNT